MSFRLLIQMDTAKARDFSVRVAQWRKANGIGQVKPGRKCVVPDAEQAGCALMDPLVERVFKILREHGAPAHWRGGQAAVLISVVRVENLNALESLSAFRDLLREARDPVIDSLRDIRDAVDNEFRNPEFVLAMFHLIASQLWELDAHAIADLLKPSGSGDYPETAIPISSNTVRNARARLREPRRLFTLDP